MVTPGSTRPMLAWSSSIQSISQSSFLSYCNIDFASVSFVAQGPKTSLLLENVTVNTGLATQNIAYTSILTSTLDSMGFVATMNGTGAYLALNHTMLQGTQLRVTGTYEPGQTLVVVDSLFYTDEVALIKLSTITFTNSKFLGNGNEVNSLTLLSVSSATFDTCTFNAVESLQYSKVQEVTIKQSQFTNGGSLILLKVGSVNITGVLFQNNSNLFGEPLAGAIHFETDISDVAEQITVTDSRFEANIYTPTDTDSPTSSPAHNESPTSSPAHNGTSPSPARDLYIKAPVLTGCVIRENTFNKNGAPGDFPPLFWDAANAHLHWTNVLVANNSIEGWDPTCSSGYVSQYGLLPCMACNPGTFAHDKKCSSCTLNHFSAKGQTSCTVCARGTSTNKKTGSTVCTKCPKFYDSAPGLECTTPTCSFLWTAAPTGDSCKLSLPALLIGLGLLVIFIILVWCVVNKRRKVNGWKSGLFQQLHDTEESSFGGLQM